MITNVADQAYEWSRDISSRGTAGEVDYEEVLEQINYLADVLYCEYEPAKTAGTKNFGDRLLDWLNGVDDPASQKLLFRLVPELFFVGQDAMDSLYQAAFHGPIARWLIDRLPGALDDPTLPNRLQEAVATTWFCEITDSMRIAKFYKLNNIRGHALRASWMTLSTLADRDKIIAYMRERHLVRIVMLEDFVGAGQQMEPMIRFAATLPGSPPILVCPMLTCAAGVTSGRALEVDYPHVTFEPSFVLPQRCCLTRKPGDREPALHASLRPLLTSLYGKVHGTKQTQPLYGAFGSCEIGALAVLYSNCPDNVPPIIHHDSDSWHAIFPRASRL